MKISDHPELAERLAAEYALGTLAFGARRRFEAQMADDAALRTVVRRWQEDLSPLADSIPAAQPPERVWRAIVGRIPSMARARTDSAGWLASLVFWRVATLSALVVAVLAVGLGRFGPLPPAVVVASAPLVTPSPTPAPAQARYVATFADPKTGRAVALVYADESGSDVSFTVLDASLRIRADQTFELWTAAPQGKGMLPAGLVPAGPVTGVVRFAVADAGTLRGATLLGLSLEPAGGSPAPTHVLGVARWVRIDA